MNTESPLERKRRLTRERKRRQRERAAAMGAREIRFDIYRGTDEALARICIAGGFKEEAEVITLLIHRADNIAKRDASRLKELLDVKDHTCGATPCN